ncbi:hypothetical protein GCM10023350_06060 [Nocardioides endophyticus]|uniref:Uncharacterized protein n=1 Tax=Nocardioides endophyticus TaxID=1353775 RepID=A0ABP8YBT3_9ACTN
MVEYGADDVAVLARVQDRRKDAVALRVVVLVRGHDDRQAACREVRSRQDRPQQSPQPPICIAERAVPVVRVVAEVRNHHAGVRQLPGRGVAAEGG